MNGEQVSPNFVQGVLQEQPRLAIETSMSGSLDTSILREYTSTKKAGHRKIGHLIFEHFHLVAGTLASPTEPSESWAQVATVYGGPPGEGCFEEEEDKEMLFAEQRVRFFLFFLETCFSVHVSALN